MRLSEAVERLQVAATQTECVCGQNAGHVGWLVCVLGEPVAPERSDREEMVRRGTERLERWRACILPPASPELLAREVLWAVNPDRRRRSP